MNESGYATLSWDKPGDGESTGALTDNIGVLDQRARIVLDAIEFLSTRSRVRSDCIGLWGISQAGYVMPKVLAQTDDVKYMIAVSCPGEESVKQMAYMIKAQAVCAGFAPDETEDLDYHIERSQTAQNYKKYLKHHKKTRQFESVFKEMGIPVDPIPEVDWEPEDLESEFFKYDPVKIIEKQTIPVLAFFGEKDTQADPIQGKNAYEKAIRKGGNKYSRVCLIPDVDHNLILSESGSLEERSNRLKEDWQNYSPEYLKVLSEWLMDLKYIVNK